MMTREEMAQNIANVTGIAPEAREPARLLALQLLRMADAEWREALLRFYACPYWLTAKGHSCPDCAPLRALLSEGKPGQ
jgi:hypothetical protein